MPLDKVEKVKKNQQNELNSQRLQRREKRALFNTAVNPEVQRRGRRALFNRVIDPEVQQSVNNNEPEEINNAEVQVNVEDEVHVSVRVHSPTNSVNLSPVISKGVTRDQGVQVNFDVYTGCIKNTRDLNTATGLQSFELLTALEEIVKIVSPKTVSASKRKNAKLSIKDKIILTLMKLKHNVSYGLLAILFKKVSAQNCRKIFLNMIKVLSAGLQYAVYWPSNEENLKNIPICFNEYADVRAVIDVIEMNIQSPKELCCQIASYSSYKSNYTIRYMTAVSPAGLITYTTKAFLGKSSDKAIFEKSQFIKLFEKGDGLMTDRGFLVDDECMKNEVKLVRPPFLRDKSKFSREEALLNAKIAKARVHIERSNQRLKIFKILSTRIPSYLIPKIDQIFIIICAIVNLSSPILAADKFNK